MLSWQGEEKKQSIRKRNKLKSFELLLFPADRKTRYLIFLFLSIEKSMKSSEAGLPSGFFNLLTRHVK
jgi:hypothetical protein